MTPLPKRTLEWMLKVKSSYNFFNKSKLRNALIACSMNYVEYKYV